jgi:hypothetical protein
MKPAAALLIVAFSCRVRLGSQGVFSTGRIVEAIQRRSRQAQLYIVRPSSFGMAVLHQVIVDGSVVGSLPTETFLVQILEPGTHTVSLFTSTSQESITIALEAAHVYYLRVGMNPAATSNRARFKLVAEDEGRALVRSNTMATSTP